MFPVDSHQVRHGSIGGLTNITLMMEFTPNFMPGLIQVVFGF
jgi:hypothetical protein